LKNICKVLSFAFIMLLSLQMLLTLTPAYAVSTTVEIVNPLDGTHEFNFTIAQKSINDTFAVNLTVNNVQELASWQARITWDPALLEYVSFMRASDDIFSTIPLGASVVTAGPDPTTPGSVLYGAAVIPPTGKQWTFNGTGRLAVLTLKIIKGVSSAGLRQVHCDIFLDSLGVDTFLLNGQSSDIPFTPVNGYYSYTAPPPPPANIYINPPKVVNPALIAGSEFNVTLNITNATSVASWSANILYDNSILNATDVGEGDFLMTINTTTFTFTILQDYNATHGMIQISCLLSSGRANGDGILSTLTFNVLALGQSTITINDANLLDEFGLPLPFSTSNGYFNNILMAKLSIDPDTVTGPSYIPGTTFTINVTLSDVENLKTCLFNLTYAPLVIQEITITVPSISGQTPIKKLQVDDDAGYIWANLTYRNGITTYSPVTAMTVQFQVLAMGVSPINLTETQLFDIADNPVVHEVHHGIFIGLIRDVAITNVVTDLTMAYQSWKVYVNVTVKNKGNLTETFDIHFFFEGNPGGTTTVSGLAPNEERVMPMIWNTSNVQPCHNYTISATADSVPFEMNLTDNTYTDGKVKIRLMGDVNGDGTVNMRDINQLLNGFRSYPGHPKWNPENDLDRNGMIDMRDINICVMNFGKTCL